MKLLLVSKDMGGAQVGAPLAQVAMNHGDEVSVISEGLAPGEFRGRNIPLLFQGTANYHEMPFTLDIDAVLKKIKPDVVVTTLGNPIHLEELIGLATNDARIPLVFLEDCHGCYTRTKAVPQVVLTLDAVAARLALTAHPHARVQIVGHPGVIPSTEVVTVKDKYLGELRENGARVYVYLGGDPDMTSEQLGLLVECLKVTKGDWVLITRFHPKWAKVTEKKSEKTYGEIWFSMLSIFGSRLKPDTVGNGKFLAASADVSLADFSTLLTTAVSCGKIAVFLETPAVISGMKSQTGLTTMPLVELGCAQRVNKPMDLSVLTRPDPVTLAGLRPYDPIIAYEKIREFLT